MDCSINECKAKTSLLITDHIKTYPILKNNNDQFPSTSKTQSRIIRVPVGL